jgi:hypothetical protein
VLFEHARVRFQNGEVQRQSDSRLARGRAWARIMAIMAQDDMIVMNRLTTAGRKRISISSGNGRPEAVAVMVLRNAEI